MNITAVVLSPEPIDKYIPDSLRDVGCKVLNHVSKFNDCAGLTAARATAAYQVTTEHLLFLDWDDDLPDDICDILRECLLLGGPLVYTDELVRDRKRGTYLRQGRPYTEEEFINNPFLIHHLAVCKTQAVRDALLVVPKGMYAFEMMVYFQIAKFGAKYLPRIGYHWNRSTAGMSHDPSCIIGVSQSVAWARRNRD